MRRLLLSFAGLAALSCASAPRPAATRAAADSAPVVVPGFEKQPDEVRSEYDLTHDGKPDVWKYVLRGADGKEIQARRYELDPRGLRLSALDTAGLETLWRYDPLGEVVAIEGRDGAWGKLVRYGIGAGQKFDAIFVECVDQGYKTCRFVAVLGAEDGNADHDDGVETTGNGKIIGRPARLGT